MIFAYVVSAAASLYVYGAALFMVHFAIMYYGYEPAYGYAAPFALSPFALPFVVGCLAIWRRIRSMPDLKSHRTISGICGIATALLGIPLVVMDSNFGLALMLAISGLLISTPLIVRLVVDRGSQ